MRTQIQFSSDNEIKLPLSYNHLIQAFIYQNISDITIRKDLHDVGYVSGKRHLKLFTFSRLSGRFQIENDTKEISFKPPVSLTISFYDDQKKDVLSEILSNILRNENLYLGKNLVSIKSVIPKKFNYTRNEYLIKMLSPILAYRTTKIDSKLVRVYISPWDREFESFIIQNIKTKINAIQESLDYDDFSIKPVNSLNENDGKIIGYKNYKLKAYYGIYRIKGNRELIKLLYDSGLGSGNSEGFGCFEILG